MRLDLLTSKKFNISRTKAASLIEEGMVTVAGRVILKSSCDVDEESELSLHQADRYVGRGANKLESIFPLLKIEPAGLAVADVGASTGGFTEYLLTMGASKVYAIDVGHDQLAKKLREDSRVMNMEGVNIRNGVELPEKIKLLVCDISFISLMLVTEQMSNLVINGGDLVLLFKPQFEVGKDYIGRGGIVRDKKRASEVLKNYVEWCGKLGLIHQGTYPSGVQGKEGNQEFFIHFKRGSL